ncbi:BrnT family toxin [Acidithiobacillus sp. MC6.1]|nr:BrnT family toxin [Acidithiobacillus sp. MC6.1]
MQFTWDTKKNEANKQKHRVSFEAATFVFSDPFTISLVDERFDDERWISIGKAGNRILYVAHTVGTDDHEEVIHIISAREAVSQERRFYHSHER